MAPTQHVPALPQADDRSPQALATRMVRYKEIFGDEGDIVRARPDLMNSLSQRLQEAGQEVPLGSNGMPEPHLALQYYDSKLNEIPESFEDHYLRLHYASSASILLDAFVVGVLGGQDPAFFEAYREVYAKLVSESTARYNAQNAKDRDGLDGLGHPTTPTPLGPST